MKLNKLQDIQQNPR